MCIYRLQCSYTQLSFSACVHKFGYGHNLPTQPNTSPARERCVALNSFWPGRKQLPCRLPPVLKLNLTKKEIQRLIKLPLKVLAIQSFLRQSHSTRSGLSHGDPVLKDSSHRVIQANVTVVFWTTRKILKEESYNRDSRGIKYSRRSRTHETLIHRKSSQWSVYVIRSIFSTKSNSKLTFNSGKRYHLLDSCDFSTWA